MERPRFTQSEKALVFASAFVLAGMIACPLLLEAVRDDLGCDGCLKVGDGKLSVGYYTTDPNVGGKVSIRFFDDRIQLYSAGGKLIASHDSLNNYLFHHCELDMTNIYPMICREINPLD